ncbi:hypothetical protein CXB49_00225 [Chromobacterium sp. ATCC 53434]|nr:hypothetical protein CXB49_00225 [Chromobacterium sp. ATCC 53434]
MHLVNEHGGGVGDAHLVLTLENGDAQVMFNVEGNPQQQKFTTDSDGGLVGNFTLRKEQLKAGTKIGGAKLHVSMNSELIGTVNIRVVASTAWALVADPTTVTVDVSGSKDVKLILKEDGIGKIGEVLEVDIDKENISGEKTLKTDTDGVATLKLGGKIPGTATVTVTHTRSKAQAIVKVEVTAVTGKHYTLKPEPATLKVELSTQKDFKVVVWDNSKNQAAGRGIAVTVTVDSKDLKDLKVGPNTDQTTDTKTTDDQGEVTFTFAGTKPETTTLTLSASDAEEVKIPLSVGVSSTLYLIQSDKPAVSILAGQTIANAPIHISVVPHDGDAPKIVHFNIIKTGLFVMVKAKDAIWRTHGDIVLDKNGNGIIDEIRAANITEKTYQIDLTATDAKPISIPVTVQSLMLNVQPASTDANPLSLPGAGQDPMPITSGMTGCVVMVSLAETHPLKPAPVGTEVDFVIVNPSSASNLAQFVLAGGALDLKASGQVKSETGLIALPTFKLTNSQLGHFHIDVYAKGQTIPAGHFYFLVREAQPIVKIEFDAEKHTGTGGYPFSPGYVVAYVNDHERVPAMPGEGRVNFTIEGPNTYYFTGSEPHSQTASVLIGRGGRAVIPQITLETAAGSFTILASSGNAKATKSNPYEVD